MQAVLAGISYFKLFSNKKHNINNFNSTQMTKLVIFALFNKKGVMKIEIENDNNVPTYTLSKLI